MRFKLDENLPAEAADLLRDAGYDAVTVLEQEMSGETDASVAAVCEQEGRVLVTPDTDFADLLRDAGYDAVTVLEQEMSGETDASVAAVCEQEGRVLVTLDTDFADLRTYPPEDYPGLFVLRLRRQDKPHVLGVLRRMLPMLGTEQLDARLWIVDEERVRIRS